MRLQFDDLTFDPDSRQLWASGVEVRLSPKAFALLAFLIERRPCAVSKADIHERLWPGTNVTDTSLPSLMSEVREAIADRRRQPRLLRTLHGFGYAFQAPAADVAVAEPTRAWLIGTNAEIALIAGENVLGRSGPGVTLLPGTTVSRRHARIALGDCGATIEDFGSKNGTFVNDRPVRDLTPLAEGDQIRFGSLLLTFHLTQPAGSTETRSSHVSGTPQAS